jgi:ATPase subunit of ABC transporter with duplicated ATPase domains
VLALNDFSFEFAGRYLFKNASWHIKPNEKIGLVGLNGTGKSTLLRLISGDYELREGTFSKPSDLRIGFLNQDLLSMDIGDCVRDVVLSGRDDLVQLENEINRLIEKIEVEYDDVSMQRLADAQERFGALGGYEWHAEGVCARCWENCFCKHPICCCWMNLQTTWIYPPFNGWRIICRTMRAPMSSFRTIRISWIAQ